MKNLFVKVPTSPRREDAKSSFEELHLFIVQFCCTDMGEFSKPSDVDLKEGRGGGFFADFLTKLIIIFDKCGEY